MSKKRAKTTKARKLEARTSTSLRRLERLLDELAEEHRALRKRVKRLTRDLEAGPPVPVFLPPSPAPGPGGRSPWGRGRPPWAKGLGPVVSLEVPLETEDPAAPLWATVAARLPEEITAVGDDGAVVRYRYSAVGSTPQAPRYRRLAEAPPPPPSPGP